MTDEAINFLFQIGFTEDEIDEFDDIKADFFDEKGVGWIGPDWLYTNVLEEDIHVDLGDTGEDIDIYWNKGWVSDFCFFRRSNFDEFEDRYYKVFPTRYRLGEFKFTKSLRRILRRNSDLKTVIRPLRITPEKSRLHDIYNSLRHGEPPRKTLLETYQYIKHYPSDLTELCVFSEEKLIACSIFEVGTHGVYSNTAFWDLSEKRRGLGIYTVLREIEYALKLEKFYYYLGFFYPHNPNYHYKTRFGGLALYDWDNDCWTAFKHPEIKELLKQKLPRRKRSKTYGK